MRILLHQLIPLTLKVTSSTSVLLNLYHDPSSTIGNSHPTSHSWKAPETHYNLKKKKKKTAYVAFSENSLVIRIVVWNSLNLLLLVKSLPKKGSFSVDYEKTSNHHGLLKFISNFSNTNNNNKTASHQQQSWTRTERCHLIPQFLITSREPKTLKQFFFMEDYKNRINSRMDETTSIMNFFNRMNMSKSNKWRANQNAIG